MKTRKRTNDEKQMANILNDDHSKIMMTSDLETKSDDEEVAILNCNSENTSCTQTKEEGNHHETIDLTQPYYKQCSVCLNRKKRTHQTTFETIDLTKPCYKQCSVGLCLNRNKHTHQTMFACRLCENVYPTQVELILHNKDHRNNNKCSVCGKKFATIANMREHTRMHTGEKPYPCSSCGKMFSNASNRNRHYRILHTDEKSRLDKMYLKEFFSQAKKSGKFSYKFI